VGRERNLGSDSHGQRVKNAAIALGWYQCAQRCVLCCAMHPFRRLLVWRRAHALALQVHEVTERNYQGRYWSLIDQMRRSATSIASNIAEGSGQVTSAQFARYLTIALGSVRELDYQVLLARDLGVIATSDCVRLDARVDQISRMLTVFRSRVAAHAVSRPTGRVNRMSGSLTSHVPRPPSD
jgi:four helix bundle protein